MALRFSKLDARAVRALLPGAAITEHGIRAEKLPSGDVRYSINVMVDGKRIHRVIGRESEGTKRGTAERAIEKLRTDARQDRLDLPEGRKLYRSFAEAAEGYIERMESAGGKDMKNKKRHIRQRLVPFLGRDRLNKISDYRLRQYRKHRTDEGASQATINRELSTLSHLLNLAASKDWAWMKQDDLPKIPKEPEARKQIRVLTAAQRKRLLSAAAEDQNERAWLFVMFGLNASMRHSEIVARRYDEVDFENCVIWINKAKAGERQQPITPALRDALLRQQKMEDDPNGWIFPSSRRGAKTEHRRDMRIPFARIVKRAELDPSICTPHVMRHTAITALVMAKTDIPTIQKISGHKTAAMVLHYVHVFGEHVHDAIRALDMAVPEPAQAL
jgi:integrase